jgi:hypothetical protein
MAVPNIALPGATLTRVAYADLPVPSAIVGLTPEQFATIPWASPLWAENEQVRIGAAAWFAVIGGKRIVFDPVQAADAVLRADPTAEQAHQAAIANVFAEAGFARESVDLLVMSHIEGVGMVAWRDADGAWSRFFPNARVLVSDQVLREFTAAGAQGDDDIQHAAWSALIEQGCVDTFVDGAEVVPGLRATLTGAHCPGHAAFHFGQRAGGGPAVTLIGHLAVSPLHLQTGECAALNAEPAAAWARLRELADDGRTLIGPLWPAPGHGRWVDGRFEPGHSM